MANTIKIKRSAVSGKVPTTTDIGLGELAINTHDGKLFLKKDDGTESIVTLVDQASFDALVERVAQLESVDYLVLQDGN